MYQIWNITTISIIKTTFSFLINTGIKTAFYAGLYLYPSNFLTMLGVRGIIATSVMLHSGILHTAVRSLM